MRIPAFITGLMLCVSICFSCGEVHAQSPKPVPMVWGGLVLASNDPSQTSYLPSELESMQARLKRVFGYHKFRLVGQGTVSPSGKKGQWMQLGNEFALSIRAANGVAAPAGSMPLKVQLYQSKQLIVETSVMLGSGSPLVIRGPFYGGNQVLILLMAR